METARVLISAILADDKFNARKTYDAEVIETLAKDIEKNGQYNPLLVAVHPKKDGKYSLISGFTRLKALQAIEEKTQKPQTAFVQVTDLTEKLDLYVLNLGENIQRRELSQHDIAARAADMSKEFELSASQIGSKIGLQGKYVSNLIRVINKVRPDILALWEQKHPKAVLANLLDLATKDPAEQIAAWNVICGLTPEGEDIDADSGDDSADATEGNGATEKPEKTDKKRRPVEAVLAAAIVAVKAAEIDAELKKGILQGLNFAIGKAKTIPGVFNPAKPVAKAAPVENGSNGAEASA